MDSIPALLSSLHCSGYQAIPPHFGMIFHENGAPGERVCIQLTKPQHKPQRKFFKIQTDEVLIDRSLESIHPDWHAYQSSPSSLRVAGTKKSNIKLYTTNNVTPPTPLNPYNSIGFLAEPYLMPRNKLISTKKCDSYHTKSYNANVVQLMDILATEEDDDDSPSPVEPPKKIRKISWPSVWCVVEQRKKGKQTRFLKGCSAKKIFGLGNSKQPDYQQKSTLHLVCEHLPVELHLDILKHMRYDQVSWLADTDERFLRLLAHYRYKLTDTTDTSTLLDQVRKEAAKEMEFRRNDDLWIVSLKETAWNRGRAKRFMIQEGVYTWHLASLVTCLKVDEEKCRCDECITGLDKLMVKMSKNQESMTFGESTLKIFALQGAEKSETHKSYASCRSNQWKWIMPDEDYTIHMWVEELENKWLIDLRSKRGCPLAYEEYRRFETFNTMIFKDPVKFFTTNKVVVWIDSGIVALTSEENCEVLGYIVEDEEHRFRLPSLGTVHTKFVGLNFLPTSLVKETLAMNHYVEHVYSHKIDEERDLVAKLIESLLTNNEEEGVQERLLNARIRQDELNYIIDNGYIPKSSGVIKECIDRNTIHVHENYEGGISFCSRYSYTPLGTSYTRRVVDRNMDLLFTVCPFEIGRPERICNLNVINAIKLHAIYSVRYCS